MKKITLIFALLVSICANAQWVTDTAVNTLAVTSSIDDQQSFGTNDGRTFIAFWKSVPAPVNYELRVQLLDAAGNKMFGDDGMLVTNTLPMSTYTLVWKATIDKYNNLYIGATGTGTGNPGHIYKVTPAGTMPWGPEGINLGTYALLPTPLLLNNNDLIISYWPGSGKGKIQRYSPEGVALWANPVDVNPSAAYPASATIVADMYQMANGDFTAVYHIKTSNGIGSLLFAQKYNGEGVAQWTAPTQLADKGTFYNRFYTGAQDGDVVYYGYSASTGLRYDGFVQRVNADGTTPWGINGKDFDTNTTLYEMDLKMAFQQGSQYVWAISRYTPSSQDLQGEYVQKFDKVTGERLLTETAHQVYAVNDTYQCHTGNLFLVADKPVFLTTTGFNNGATPIVLGATLLNSSGNPLLEAMMPVGTYAACKGRITLCRPFNNQAVAVFTENKGSASKIYAQNFSTAVSCEMMPVAVDDFTKQCSVAYSDLTAPHILDTCGNPVTATTNTAIFPITTLGTTTITWLYTGISGATATVNQNIIVTEDTTVPVATVLNLPAITAQCEVTAATAVAPVATDTCAGTITATANVTFPITAQGTTVITWTYTDGNNNTLTQTQNVVITDTAAPVAAITNLAAITASCEVTAVTAVAPTATDACAGTITATTNTEFPITAQGTTVITWTYNDGHGNTTTQTQNVIINDNVAPTLQLQNSTMNVNEDGVANLTGEQFDNGSTDGCGIASWAVTPESFTCAQLGQQTVIVTVTDVNGNVSTGTATVTVTDENHFCTAGVAAIEKESFLLYPNPASDVVYIRPAPNTVITSVRVYSIIGQELFTMNNSKGTDQCNIPLSNYQAGTYIVSIETSAGKFTKKVVKI